MRFLPILLLFIAFSFAGFAQKYSFITYSTEEGLPQSQVTAIEQDEEGYLWVGTIGGLTKFNGEEFEPFTTREGLLNNRITSLNFFEKTLWVGHDGGISSMHNGEIKKYAFSGEDKSRPVNQIIRFKGTIVVCSNGGGLFKLVNGNLTKIKLNMLSSNRVRGAIINDGKLMLATKNGIITTEDLESFKIDDEFGLRTFSSIINTGKEIIATSFDSLLVRKNLTTGKINFSNPEHIKSIHGCYYDASDNLWLYGRVGLIRLGSDGSENVFNQEVGLPIDVITCVFQDRHKNIWAGSQGKGVFRFPGLRFSYFDQSTGFISDLMTCGFEESNGHMYLGTFDKGILHRFPNGTVEQVEQDNPNVTVWASIPNVDGKNWFGTQKSLIAIDKSGAITKYLQTKYPGLPGQRIVCFERIDSKSMYIGGNEGVSIYKDGKITKISGDDKELLGTVRDLEIVNGELYCVSNLGMYVYRNGEFVPVKQGMERVSYNIVSDASGTIWVGTDAGLFFYRNGEMMQMPLLDDDPRANVVNLMDYRDGKLYVGTNNGLFTISKVKGEYTVRRFARGDGIPDLETNLNSGFFDKDGNYWFGTSSGLVKYNLDVSGIGVRRPLVHLKSILLNYAPFDYSLYSDELLPNGIPKQLVLPFNKNNLVFELDGVALVNHDELKYQFKLKGLNDKWSPLSPVNTITFTNLPAGDYTLMVRAVDLDGRQSEVEKLPFVIGEAFYKTWWFITLCVLLAGSLILLLFRLRLRRIQEVNENKVLSYRARMLALEQKSLNASMNRHFIFNSLNSIQYFINTRDRLSANKYLTNFAKLIRKNLDSASWEDNRITLEEEISRIELYLSLESMRFKDRFDYKITTGDIDLEMYKIPAMILQPFIENSIIHGILPKEETKGLIEIDIQLKGNMLEVLIKDNGIGVNQSMSRKATDTGDHRSQGMEITSKRIELMQKFSDDAMELIGPAEIVGDDGSINGTYVLLKLRADNLED